MTFSIVREGPERSFAGQGTLLAGPGVVDAMVERWLSTAGEPSLARPLDLHDRSFGRIPDAGLLPYDQDLLAELRRRLAAAGYGTGDVERGRYDWMGRGERRGALARGPAGPGRARAPACHPG